MGRAALLIGILASGAAAPASQPSTFRSGVDLTTFGVTVVDRRGEVVRDLTREDFEVVEDGVPQRLAYFAQGDGDAAPEMHLGLMLDASGSMSADLQLARSAAIRFLNLLPEALDITLVDFDTQVRITRYPQQDFPRLVERIRQRKPDGWTALYDALGTYLHGAQEQDGRKILVMFTDGGDTRSALGLDDTLTLLKASRVTLYAIGLQEHAGSARFELQRRLRQFAETTGGQAFFPNAMKDVEAAYEKVLAEIKAQYHLGYVSTNAVADGAWRKVEVRLKRPGVKVRTRQGYFAPYVPSQ